MLQESASPAYEACTYSCRQCQYQINHNSQKSAKDSNFRIKALIGYLMKAVWRNQICLAAALNEDSDNQIYIFDNPFPVPFTVFPFQQTSLYQRRGHSFDGTGRFADVFCNICLCGFRIVFEESQ